MTWMIGQKAPSASLVMIKKLGRIALGGCAAIQRNLNRLEKCADWNLTQFNKEMCQVLVTE